MAASWPTKVRSSVVKRSPDSACTNVSAPNERPRTSSGITIAERIPIARISSRCVSSCAEATSSSSGMSDTRTGTPVRETSMALPGAAGSGG